MSVLDPAENFSKDFLEAMVNRLGLDASSTVELAPSIRLIENELKFNRIGNTPRVLTSKSVSYLAKETGQEAQQISAEAHAAFEEAVEKNKAHLREYHDLKARWAKSSSPAEASQGIV